MNLLIGIGVSVTFTLLSITNMILISRYTLIQGVKIGLWSATGAMLGQFIWGIAGLLFLIFVGFGHGNFNHPSYIALPAAAFIFYIAYRIYTAPIPEIKTEKNNTLGAFSVVLAATLVKPQRLFAFAGLFILFGAHTKSLHALATWLPLSGGIIIGSLIAWILFVLIVACFRKKATPEVIHRFSKIGAIIIILIGITSLASFYM